MGPRKNVRRSPLRIVGPASGVGFFVAMVAAGCSPDVTGLGNFDSGTAGSPHAGTGGASGGGPGSTGGTGGQGAAIASGGRPGTGGKPTTGGGGTVGGGGSGGTNVGGRGGRGAGATGSGGAGGNGETGGRTGGAGGGGADGRGGRGGSGSAGSGGTGSKVPEPECTKASECRLDDDCCSCIGAPVSAPPTVSCTLACKQNQCSALQLPDHEVPACAAGRCVAGFNCNDSRVTCKIAVPSCPQGEVPGVTDSGECYTGVCVPAAQCVSVPSCGSCGRNEVCVVYQTKPTTQVHCVALPAACGGAVSCGCLGPSVCTGAYKSCAELSGPAGVTCACPNC